MNEPDSQKPLIRNISKGIMSGNPVFIKDLRVLTRQQRSRSVLIFYLVIMAMIAFLLYTTIMATNAINPDPDIRRTLGKIIFLAVVFTQLIAIMFILPLFSADAITRERENNTLDLLRITQQSPASIVRGKLFAGFMFIILLLIIGLPLKSSAYLLGGITIYDFLISTVLLLTTTLFLSSLSIWASSRSKRTSTSMGLIYITAGMALLGIPALGYVIIRLAPIPEDQSLIFALQLILKNLDPNLRVIFILLVWLLIASNPITTAIFSYSLLQNEGFQLTYDLPSFALQFPLIAPWIIFILLYLIFFGLLYRSTVREITKRNML